MNLRKTIAAIFTVLISLSVSGQNFEGKIVYANSFTSKNAQMTDEMWTIMLGAKQEFFIKGSNYKSLTNGTMAQWQLYLSKDNKLYSKMANSESVLWNDATVRGDEILKAEVNKAVVDILGYKCDEVVLTCKSGVQKYYFSSKVAMDANLYKNHLFGNWYDFLAKSNALPLKSVIETAQFTMISVATEVKPMKLDAAIFALPAGVKTEKSPY